jgi:hypothetical protein
VVKVVDAVAVVGVEGDGEVLTRAAGPLLKVISSGAGW